MERITIIDGLRGGRPTIRGFRLTVSEVLVMLSSGMSETDILEAFPALEKADLVSALRFAARVLDEPARREWADLLD